MKMTDKKRIMLVDDEDGIRRVAASVLARHGYETMDFNNAQDALGAWHGYKPDVVLTDFRMPDMDGYQLSERLIFDGYRGKKVLMSGNPGELYERHPEVRGLFDAYFDGFIQKPFASNALLAELERVLSL